LVAGGPAEGIDDYEDARPVIQSYLDQMASSAETVPDFLYVNSIKGYLDEDESVWERRYNAGWSVECRATLRVLCDSILGLPKWVDEIQAKLGSEDQVEVAQADQAAKSLGIETWGIHWRRLQAKPADPGRWYPVMALCDEDRVREVIDFAEANLDLAGIATGAADELWLGRGLVVRDERTEQHSCLDCILQELRRFPGRGATLIEAGLKSRVVRNRNLAVAALAGWPRGEWPSELDQALNQAARCEPNESVRETMQKALRRESLAIGSPCP
jgi:hypothetical protein